MSFSILFHSPILRSCPGSVTTRQLDSLENQFILRFELTSSFVAILRLFLQSIHLPWVYELSTFRFLNKKNGNVFVLFLFLIIKTLTDCLFSSSILFPGDNRRRLFMIHLTSNLRVWFRTRIVYIWKNLMIPCTEKLLLSESNIHWKSSNDLRRNWADLKYVHR